MSAMAALHTATALTNFEDRGRAGSRIAKGGVVARVHHEDGILSRSLAPGMQCLDQLASSWWGFIPIRMVRYQPALFVSRGLTRSKVAVCFAPKSRIG